MFRILKAFICFLNLSLIAGVALAYQNPISRTVGLSGSAPGSLTLPSGTAGRNTGGDTSVTDASILTRTDDLTLNSFGSDGKLISADMLQNKGYFIESQLQAKDRLLGVAIKTPTPTQTKVYQLFSHGRPGALFINGQWLSGYDLSVYLKPLVVGYAHINIYGCEFAKGVAGQQAVLELEVALGVSVSASNNVTGVDGDWILEYGPTTAQLVISNYPYNLQTCAGTAGGTAPGDDLDSDGVCNQEDLDDDNDGILDTDEGICGIPASYDWIDDPAQSSALSISPLTFGDTFIDLSISGLLTGSLEYPDETGGGYSGWRIIHDGQTNGESITAVLDFQDPVNFLSFSLGDLDEGTTNSGRRERAVVNIILSDGSTYVLSASELNLGTDVVYLGNNTFVSSGTNTPPHPTQTLEINSNAVNIDSLEITIDFEGGDVGNGYVMIGDLSGCTAIDTDDDGIPDYQDTDSDGDGCFDALEGGGSILSSNLDSTGSLIITPPPLGVDVNGVPVDYTGQGVPQGGGSSTDSSVQSLSCTPPVANDDSNLNNAPGTSVSTNILSNDSLADGSIPSPADVTVTLDETSVPNGILNGNGSVTVPGEGIWTYNSTTGQLEFAPCTAAGVPDASCLGLLTGDPSPIDYTITETATGLTSPPASVTVGYVPTTISGTLVNDIDGDGTDNTGDGVLVGVTVNLLDGSGNPVLDETGNPITAVTNSSGSYSFSGNIPEGNYQISVDPSTLPGGASSDPAGTFDPDGIGTPNIATISVTPGTDVTGQDFGYTGESLPITLSSFNSVRSGVYVDIDWGTSSELFNVGFQLWGLDGVDGKWEKLHNWLVRSGSGNAVEPQSYGKRVRIPGSIDQLVSVGISSVDSDGSEHYYGPFEVGQSYGDLGALEPIAWDDVRAQLDAQMAQAGYVKDRVNGYRKVNGAPLGAQTLTTLTDAVVQFSVSADGLYRITAAELAAAGIDWSGELKRDIALIDATGKPVVRYVKSRRTFGTNGEIYFYGNALDEQAGLYTDQSVYRLVLDRYRALNARIQRKSGVSNGFSESYTETSTVEDDKYYILTSAADDPWLSDVVVSQSSQPRLYGRSVPMEPDADLTQPMTIHMSVGKSSNLPGAGDEHVVQGLAFSDNALLYLDTQTSNNSGLWELDFEVPSGTPWTIGDDGNVLVGGSFSPGPGYGFSEIHIDSVGLSYTRPYTAKSGDNYLEFRAPNAGELGYEVVVPNKGYPWVFASDGGNLVRLLPESAPRSRDADGNKIRTVRFAALSGSNDSDEGLQYWVGGRNQASSVTGLRQRDSAAQAGLLAQAQGSNYVLIAHPAFMGATLDGYASHKQSQGYTVSIVNYLDIVDGYGGGQSGPVGLTNYLSALDGQGNGIDHVLIVGGSTYDHTDILGTGALTFIPGHYGQSNYSKFTLSDAPYVMNSDGQVFANIGRWPVRSMSDLQVIVDKSILWSSTDHSNGEALLIAEHTIDGENINFTSALDGVAAILPATYYQTKVYVDQIMADDPTLSLTDALSQAKAAIIAELNATPDIVLYNGHGSTRQLSNQNLFKAGDIAQVSAGGAEVWMPMSCYVTLYESTHVNTLAHQLLFSGNAVNITGAMLLSNQVENLQVGASILDNAMNNGQTIGEAVNQSKAAQNNPKLDINWSLLGDPTNTLQ